MKGNFENEIALVVMGAITGIALFVLPDAAGKDVALAIGGAVGGFLTKTLMANETKKPF